MKIVIPGGSGQVGKILTRAFKAVGHEVVVLGRSPIARLDKNNAGRGSVRCVNWDAKNLGPWAAEFDDADVVVNLAGRSVNCRYTKANRRRIIDSRVDSTRVVGEAIARARKPPRVWLQASTATIYAHRFDAANDEASGILGGAERGAADTWRFSIDVARAWEDAANEAVVPDTRKILMRSAMIMSPDAGGVFDALLRLVRWRLGGRHGDGRQYVSWIHKQDFVRAVDWLIERYVAGAVNLAAPNPIPNEEFMRTLRTAWGARLGLPASHWMLELGTFLFRTESELILKSRRVVPGRLLRDGFQFRFPNWAQAAYDLCQCWPFAC